MAYRELTMIDVREILRRWQARYSARQIAHQTAIDRKTIGRYIEYAETLALPRDRDLTDEEINGVAQCVQAREVASASVERQDVGRFHDQIKEWLEQRPPLKLTKIHQLLQRRGLQATYWTLRRYAIKELNWQKREPTILLDDPEPGLEAQVDFGLMGYIIEPEAQRRVKLWALIITLSFSRHMFVWPTLRQTTEAVCEGLDRAWKFFGGQPKVIIPDNMKAMVLEPDELSSRLTDAFADYAAARGLFTDPARVRRPKDKPRVENQVPYVRENWFQGESFKDIDDARRSAEQWCRETAGQRIHGTTRKAPLEQYESVEKSTMRPAPTESFDVPTWGDATVHPDHHINFLCALYSAPTQYLHKRVRVRADSKLVRIYLGTELIKVHARQPKGGRSTDVNDYPKGKAMYAMRSIDKMLAAAKQRGSHVGLFAERLLSGPLPWARMRQAYALLGLCEKYGDGRVEAVCQTALAFEMFDVKRIKRMVQVPTRAEHPAIREAGSITEAKVIQLPLPRFARTVEHFETRSTTRQEGDGQ
jgi:transposase